MTKKKKNCMKQLQEMYRNIWKLTRETFIWPNFIPRAELSGRIIYMNIHRNISITYETHLTRIIRRNNSVYILDILHMIQNPHLHASSSYLTIKSLQVINQVASFLPCGRLLAISNFPNAWAPFNIEWVELLWRYECLNKGFAILKW